MDNKKAFEQPGVYSDTVAELSKKFIEANNKLKESERQRTEMIENISHDLRAPLTAIRSTIDYCIQKTADGVDPLTEDEAGAMLKVLDSRVKTLEVLVKDLYLLTCIDSGREEFRFRNIPLAQFLEEYFYAAEIDDKYTDYNLVMDIPDNMEASVSVDVSKISRVLDNLFTNACKYSDKGSRITLGAGIENERTFFYVEDNGWGIPEDSVPHVFDRTYKVSNARTPNEDTSSGLGLAITKSIVMQHGGEIKCDSKLGKGSRFTVFLTRIDDLDETDE